MNDVNMHLQFSIRKREEEKMQLVKWDKVKIDYVVTVAVSRFFFAIFLNIISTSNHEHEICVLINASADSRVVIDELVLGDLKKDDTIFK